MKKIIFKPKPLSKAEQAFVNYRMRSAPEYEIPTASVKIAEYAGGDGSSKETAIIVKAKNEDDQIEQEHLLIAKLFGNNEVLMQAIIREDHKTYDMLRIKCKNQVIEIWFDISQFHTNI